MNKAIPILIKASAIKEFGTDYYYAGNYNSNIGWYRRKFLDMRRKDSGFSLCFLYFRHEHRLTFLVPYSVRYVTVVCLSGVNVGSLF